MNYSKMYAILCGAASEAIDFIDQRDFRAARECLLTALETAESLYIGEYYIEENERLKQEPTAAVPEEVTARNLALITKLFERE